MHRILEQMHRHQGKRPPRKTPASVFRTQVWLDNILNTHRISLTEFESIIRGDGDTSSLPNRWLRGVATVTPPTVNKIESFFPGSRAIYDIALYELLTNWTLTKKKIDQLIGQYRPKDELYAWGFPNNRLMRNQKGAAFIYQQDPGREYPEWYIPNDGLNGQKSPLSYVLSGANSFVQRSDIFAFMAVLGMAREAETNQNDADFLSYMADAYRIFPAIARLKVFHKRWEELYKLLETIFHRSSLSRIVFKVDKDIIEQQIYAEVFITERHCQPRDPKTFRFIPNDDPIIYARGMY